MVDQKDSIRPLSTLEATRPIEPSSPAARSRWPKIQDVYWADSASRRNTGLLQGH
jgi:hypothetical protein